MNKKMRKVVATLMLAMMILPILSVPMYCKTTLSISADAFDYSDDCVTIDGEDYEAYTSSSDAGTKEFVVIINSKTFYCETSQKATAIEKAVNKYNSAEEKKEGEVPSGDFNTVLEDGKKGFKQIAGYVNVGADIEGANAIIGKPLRLGIRIVSGIILLVVACIFGPSISIDLAVLMSPILRKAIVGENGEKDGQTKASGLISDEARQVLNDPQVQSGEKGRFSSYAIKSIGTIIVFILICVLLPGGLIFTIMDAFI